MTPSRGTGPTALSRHRLTLSLPRRCTSALPSHGQAHRLPRQQADLYTLRCHARRGQAGPRTRWVSLLQAGGVIMTRTLLLAVVLCTIGGCTLSDVGTLDLCRVHPELVYAPDQLDAISDGCPLGLSPTGHPLTHNTPYVDVGTGLPTDTP